MYQFIVITLITATRTLAISSNYNCFEDCNNQPFGHKIPDPTDCNGYFLSHNEFMIQQYCPSGMKFDESQQKCIWGKCPPCSCECESCGTTTSTDTSMETSTTEAQTTTLTTSAISTVTTLSTESTINTDVHTTETPTSAATSDIGTSTSTREPPTTEDKPDCGNLPNGTLLPHREHCRFFWRCLNQIAILSFCEVGLWYDRVHYVCNYPELADCPANQG